MCHKPAVPTHRVPVVPRATDHEHSTVLVPSAPLRCPTVRDALPLETIALSDQPSMQCRDSRQPNQNQSIIQTPTTNTIASTALSAIWPSDLALPASFARCRFPPFTFPSSISKQCATLLHSPFPLRAPQIAVQSDSVWSMSTACVKLLAELATGTSVQWCRAELMFVV